MYVCPYCEWPFALKSELATHIQIKHKGELSNLLQQIQDEVATAHPDDELLDDGIYIGDTVVHAPYDDDPEQEIIDEYYERLEQKEWDKWELRGYWNV